MTKRPTHQQVEERFREILAAAQQPAPDECSRWRDCVVFGWREPRAIVAVDLDEVDLNDLANFDPTFALMDPNAWAETA